MSNSNNVRRSCRRNTTTQLVSADVDFDDEEDHATAIVGIHKNDDNENDINNGRRVVLEAHSNGRDARASNDNSDRSNNSLHHNNDTTSNTGTNNAAESAAHFPFRRRGGEGAVFTRAAPHHHRHKTQESRFGTSSTSSSTTTTATTIVATNKDKKSNKSHQQSSGAGLSLIRFTVVMTLFLIGFVSIRNARSNHGRLYNLVDNNDNNNNHQNRLQKQHHVDEWYEQKNTTSLSIGSATPGVPVVVGEEEELGTGHHQCGIWMAPSSIRPYPGYGIFTTRNINSQDYILHGPDAVSIPLHDMRTIRKGDHKLPLYEERRRVWRNVFSNYVWARGATDHALYDNPSDSVDFQPGFGSLPNHHCILNSLGSSSENNPYRDDIIGNRTSPGLGASSYSVGRAFYALRDLNAGEEIFLNYGHCSREKGRNPKWASNAIFPDDILEAARIVKLFEPFGSKEWPAKDDITDLEDFVDKSSGAITRFVVAILSRLNSHESRQQLYDTYQSIIDKDNSNSKAKDAIVKSMAKTRKEDSRERLAEKKIRFEVAKLSLIKPRRGVSWIQDNGICLEHLIPKKSKIPDAGFGGFSQYGIQKGEIVVPVPVLHVTQKEVLELYDLDSNGDLQQKGKSLLVNYCFGHAQSTMLLCPMTGALLINHCSTRTQSCGPKGPNAAVHWSSGWDPNSHEWRNKSIPEIGELSGRIFSLEIVATRDIRKGEEVYIDYGEEWEEAWSEHLASWQPPPKVHSFISAEEMNSRKGLILDFLVSGDLRKRVKHPYLFAGCQYFASDDVDNGVNYTEPNEGWMNLTDREILETYGSSAMELGYRYGKYADHRDRSHWPCSIVRAESERGHYTVRINASPLISDVPAWKANKLPRFITGYPKDAIHWFVYPQATDQRLPNAFRMSMNFPGWPEQWKNADVIRNNRRLGKDFYEVSVSSKE